MMWKNKPANNLPQLLTLFISVAGTMGCKNSTPSQSFTSPPDQPILLREGQAVVLVQEENRKPSIAAAVVDGKLPITEIDPYGKNFGVTWNDEESWETR